jgi:hypothetical protein
VLLEKEKAFEDRHDYHLNIFWHVLNCDDYLCGKSTGCVWFFSGTNSKY